MVQPHELRCYQYVNRPYEKVREALRADPGGIFQRATMGAASRADKLAANLRVELAGLEVGREVTITIVGVEDREPQGGRRVDGTRIRLTWQAARAAGIFPSMEAELAIYPLSAEETQLDLHGVYRPPLGVFGNAVDSLVGHRLADASVHRFVEDIARLLSAELPA